MSFLESMQSVAENDCQIQELGEEVEQAASLVLLILTALQLGRAIAVKAVEEILNERGQDEAEECAPCEKCKAKLESKGLRPREILTVIGRVKWKRRVRRCPNGCEGSQVAPSELVNLIWMDPYSRYKGRFFDKIMTRARLQTSYRHCSLPKIGPKSEKQIT